MIPNSNTDVLCTRDPCPYSANCPDGGLARVVHQTPMPLLMVCLYDRRVTWQNTAAMARLGDVLGVSLDDLAWKGTLDSLLDEAGRERYGARAQAIAHNDGPVPRLWDVLAAIPVKPDSHQCLLLLSPSYSDIASFILERTALMAMLTDRSGLILWATPAAFDLIHPKAVGDNIVSREPDRTAAKRLLELALKSSPRAFSERISSKYAGGDVEFEVDIEPVAAAGGEGALLWRGQRVPDERAGTSAITALERISSEVRRFVLTEPIPPFRVPAELPEMDRLTDQEKKIVTLMARGLRPQAIGARLFISPSSVRNHLSRIYRKLGVANQAELLQRLLSDDSDL